MITPVLSPERYAIERAICDKASAYAESVMGVSGTKRRRHYLTAEEEGHPDYAACDNAMRRAIEAIGDHMGIKRSLVHLAHA